MKKPTEDHKNSAKKVAGNYEKHPFFVKKNNASKEFLAKAGLPENYKAKAVHAS